MSEPFAVRMTVRSYEIDQLGHVNHAVYHQYAEHARLELLRAAGCPINRLVHAQVGIVLLESHVRFLAELRLGDEVDVTCLPHFDARTTFRLDSTISKPDGTISADVECRFGLLDLDTRRLLTGPRDRLIAFATDPTRLHD